MSRSGSKRRKHPRYEVAGLLGRLVVPIHIEVINLSLGGMALETNSYLQFGREYSLKLEGRSGALRLSGTVAWCALRRTEATEGGEVVPVYRAGLRFRPLTTRTAQDLWDLIRRHALVELEDSILGRFRVDLERDPQMGTSYDFAVRKLSLSGMLIETDFEPALDSNFELLLRLGAEDWETRARVASVPAAGLIRSGELIEVGLEFLRMSARDLSRLRQFIDTRLRQGPES